MRHVLAAARAHLRRVAPGWGVGAWRCFWVLMLVGHTPGWIASCGEWGGSTAPFDLGRWTLLTASQLLFVLKALDVPWLRLPRDRRAWLTVTIAITLLHADAVRRYAAADGSRQTPVYATAVAAGAAVVLGLRSARVRRLFESLHPRAWQCRVRHELHLLLSGAERALLPPRFLLLVRACRVNRAPPI